MPASSLSAPIGASTQRTPRRRSSNPTASPPCRADSLSLPSLRSPLDSGKHRNPRRRHRQCLSGSKVGSSCRWRIAPRWWPLSPLLPFGCFAKCDELAPILLVHPSTIPSFPRCTAQAATAGMTRPAQCAGSVCRLPSRLRVVETVEMPLGRLCSSLPCPEYNSARGHLHIELYG
jgi:hypothetical protein